VNTPPVPRPRLLVAAGFVTWALVAVPTLLGGTGSPRFGAWLAAWMAFALLLVAAWRRPPSPRTAVVVRLAQTAAVLTMVALLCNGFEGALLVLLAADLGLSTRLRAGLAWIVLQTAAMAVAIALHWAPRPAVLIAPPYLGFQLFAFLTVRYAAREADRTRLDERLRLAQDLHDALGHHLTALSLNLEVAAHQTEGSAHENVRTAQSLARLLLHDVKEIADALKADEPIDLPAELHRLARGIPIPHVHLDLPPDLRLGTPRRSRAVLRCVQEIVTNAIRHGEARNLWVALRAENGVVRLAARDDGSGAAALRDGGGLSGMRRRLEELGGTLSVETSPASGFSVEATLPREDPA